MWAHCVEEVAIVAVRWGDYGGGVTVWRSPPSW